MMAWLEEIYETREKVLTLQEFGNNEEAQKYNIEYPWIKYQLNWIHKEYDPTKWIHITNHKNTEEELYRMLEMYCDTYLTEEYEKYLKTLIIRYGASMQPTHPIANTKCSRVKAVNEAFQEWDIPYYIEKKHKSINGKQRDYWRIVRNTTLCE